MKKRFLSMVMAAIILSLTSSLNVSAEGHSAILNKTQNSGVSMYGVLSGYAQHTQYSTDSTSVTFNIDVTGSWSAYAGWTVKTNFNGDVKINRVYLTRPNGSQIGSTLYPNTVDEITNKLLTNVPVGTYTVHYDLDRPTTGTIQVWIY